MSCSNTRKIRKSSEYELLHRRTIWLIVYLSCPQTLLRKVGKTMLLTRIIILPQTLFYAVLILTGVLTR